MSEPVTFETRGLDKHFGNLHVTWFLNFEVHTGMIHALIGPNGAGKTTALSQMSGELAPDSGSIHLNGRDITRVDLPGRVAMGICRSYQTSSPFPDFTVGENLALALLASSDRRMRFFRNASHNEDRKRRAEELLTDLGLDVDPDTPVAELDHGATRQLEIAMVLATAPSVLLLDEPMAGLAPGEVEGLSDLLGHLRSDHAMVLVEHDMDVVFSLADQVTVLADGTAVATGTPSEIRENQGVQDLYLREATDDQ